MLDNLSLYEDCNEVFNGAWTCNDLPMTELVSVISSHEVPSAASMNMGSCHGTTGVYHDSIRDTCVPCDYKSRTSGERIAAEFDDNVFYLYLSDVQHASSTVSTEENELLYEIEKSENAIVELMASTPFLSQELTVIEEKLKAHEVDVGNVISPLPEGPSASHTTSMVQILSLLAC